MGDKYKWIRTWWPVGLVAFAVITSYITLQSDVVAIEKDTLKVEIKAEKLDEFKLDKETFEDFQVRQAKEYTEYKDRQEKEFDEFKANQKETNKKLHSIDLKMVTIEEQLKQILTAVNNK